MTNLTSQRSARLQSLVKLAETMKKKKLTRHLIENALSKQCRLVWGLSDTARRDYVNSALEIAEIK